jgi:hypothetical protein
MRQISVLAITVCLLSIGLAQTTDPPPQKEGLWSVHRESSSPGKGKSQSTETLCRNHEYDKYILDKSKNSPGCKVVSSSLNDGTYTIEKECNVGESVVKSKETSTYKDTEVHIETHATYAPPLMGMTEITLVMDQKFQGACPAGTNPGDVTRANGKKINTWPKEAPPAQ